MKKFLSLTALVLALLLLASCGNKQDKAPENGAETTAATTESAPATAEKENTAEDALEAFFNCLYRSDDAELLASLMVDPALKEYYFTYEYYESEEEFVAEFQDVIDNRAEYIADLKEENGAEYEFNYKIISTTEYSEDDLVTLAEYLNEDFLDGCYAAEDIEAFTTFEVEVTEKCGDYIDTYEETLSFIKIRGEWSFSFYGDILASLDDGADIDLSYDDEYETEEYIPEVVKSSEEAEILSVFDIYFNALFVDLDVDAAYGVCMDKYTLDIMLEDGYAEDEEDAKAQIGEICDAVKIMYDTVEDEGLSATVSYEVVAVGNLTKEALDAMQACAVEDYGYAEGVIEDMAIVVADGKFEFGSENFGGEEGFLLIKVDGEWYVSSLIAYYDLQWVLEFE